MQVDNEYHVINIKLATVTFKPYTFKNEKGSYNKW